MWNTLSIALLTLQVAAHSVPSTFRSSCSPELVTVGHGSSMILHCGSHCSESKEGSYTWWRIGDKDRKKTPLGYRDAVVTEFDITGENGGEYECKCGSTGQICTFYVAVLPEITFTSSRTATHYGDVAMLKCTTDSYPSNGSTITNAFGIVVGNQAKKRVSPSRIETLAIVEDLEEEDYVCLFETHYKGHPVAQQKQHLKINLYNPPSIMYTTEYVLREERGFGRPGELSCVVQTSPDTQSRVVWWAGGRELEEGGGNYRMSSSAMSDTVTVFKLHMESVEESDIGPYICQLSSDYNVEESQDAWIRVDYRKEATRIEGATDNKALGGSPRFAVGEPPSNSLRTVTLLLCLVVVTGLGMWGVMVRRRRWKKAGGRHGIIGREDGYPPSTGSSVAHTAGTRMTAFKRK